MSVLFVYYIFFLISRMSTQNIAHAQNFFFLKYELEHHILHSGRHHQCASGYIKILKFRAWKIPLRMRRTVSAIFSDLYPLTRCHFTQQYTYILSNLRSKNFFILRMANMTFAHAQNGFINISISINGIAIQLGTIVHLSNKYFLIQKKKNFAHGKYDFRACTTLLAIMSKLYTLTRCHIAHLQTLLV